MLHSVFNFTDCYTIRFRNYKRVFRSQPQCGCLTRLRLSCHIWKLIMQLGQPQPTFAKPERKLGWTCDQACNAVWLTRVIFHSVVGWRDVGLNQHIRFRNGQE